MAAGADGLWATDPNKKEMQSLGLPRMQDKGADLTGVVERSELERMVRQMKGGAKAAGGSCAS